MATPFLANARGTPYEDWDNFDSGPGFPDLKLPSTPRMCKLALEHFSNKDLVLVAGITGGPLARRMRDSGMYVICQQCIEPASVQYCSTLMALEWPPVAGRFAGAVCFDTFSHLLSPPGAMRDLHRLLMPGGTLVFDVLTPSNPAFGCGLPLDKDAFVVTNTINRFFDSASLAPLVAGMFEICELPDPACDERGCAIFVAHNLGGV
jgi:hypothetical protein